MANRIVNPPALQERDRCNASESGQQKWDWPLILSYIALLGFSIGAWWLVLAWLFIN